MKHPPLTILLISFYIVATSFVLMKDKSANYFEEGVFNLRAYMAEGKDTFDFSRALLVVDSGMYLVKGNKIKRKAYHSWEEGTEFNNGATLNKKIEKIQHAYLMDFDIGLVFSYSPDSSVIKERPITALNFDLLYGPLAQNVTQLIVLHIDTTNIGSFNGKPVYRGTAFSTERKDTAVFLFAANKLPVKSPINNWIPGFKHDIIALAMKHKKNAEKDTLTWLVLEIYNIARCTIDPREFIVDSSKITRS